MLKKKKNTHTHTHTHTQSETMLFCLKNKKKNYAKRCHSDIYIYIYDLSVDSVQVSVLDLRSDFCTTQASELGFPSVHRPQLHRLALAAL